MRKTVVRTISLFGLGLLAAFGVDRILGGSRYKLWVFDAGASVDCASQLCGNGTLITGNYDRVLALDRATGRKRWSFAPPEGSENLAAAPVVGADDTVYVPSQREGKLCRVFALDATSGRPRRVIDEPASALVPGERHTLFLGFHRVMAVDETTGSLLWTFQPPERDSSYLSNGDGHVEAMARTGRTLYAVLGCPVNTLYALDASTGRPRWGVPFDRMGELPCSVPASLVLTGDGTPIISLSHASLCAYDARSGHRLWQRPPLGGFRSAQLQVGPGAELYAGNDQGTVAALDTRRGARLWERRLGAKISHPPVLSSDGVLYIGTNANRVYALDAATGDTRWSIPLGGPSRDVIPGYGEDVSLTLGPNGTVYAASSDGRIYALHSP